MEGYTNKSVIETITAKMHLKLIFKQQGFYEVCIAIIPTILVHFLIPTSAIFSWLFSVTFLPHTHAQEVKWSGLSVCLPVCDHQIAPDLKIQASLSIMTVDKQSKHGSQLKICWPCLLTTPTTAVCFYQCTSINRGNGRQVINTLWIHSASSCILGYTTALQFVQHVQGMCSSFCLGTEVPRHSAGSVGTYICWSYVHTYVLC